MRVLSLLVACARAPEDADDSGIVDDTDTAGPSCVVEPDPPATKDTGGAPTLARVMQADLTWTLTFDAEAQAAGFRDCSYRRVYGANIEVADQGYLCPACDVITAGTAVMTEGYDTCFLQIDDAPVERVEMLGMAEVEGVNHLFRGGNENVVLRDMGAFAGDTIAWADEATLETGGTMFLAAAGTATIAESDGVMLPDPSGARTTPYACGWPTNSPGGASPDAPLALGSVVPNVRLDDQCGEGVDLWDFRGYYLVVDASSPNCGPCQTMAREAEAFKAQMDAACVPVELITLLNASLSGVNMPAELAVRLDWAETFGLTSPVLGDRGYGYALFPAYLEADGMSLPSTIVVDPEGRLLYGASGYSSWDEFATVILDDVAARGE